MSKGSQAVRIQINSPAKVNLFLEILGRRADGFHELETVMSTVSLYDSLSFTLGNGNQDSLRIMPDGNSIPTGPENLVLKALAACRQNSQSDAELAGIDVILRKRIPVAAGLGGASGNAAAAVVAANRLWNLNLSPQKFQCLLQELGSDVPFFLTGGTAFCSGRGEKVSRLPAPAGIPIVIATPPDGLSTAKVYSCVTAPEQPQKCPWNHSLGQIGSVMSQMFNRLEEFAGSLTPWIENLKKEFGFLGATSHQLSGSGSSYFGVFHSVRQAHMAANKLANQLPQLKVFCVQTTNHSLLSSCNIGSNIGQVGLE